MSDFEKQKEELAQKWEGFKQAVEGAVATLHQYVAAVSPVIDKQFHELEETVEWMLKDKNNEKENNDGI